MPPNHAGANRRPALFVLSLLALSVLPACLDRLAVPHTYAFRRVNLVDRGDEKVATLGAPALAAGRCAMRGDATYVLKPTGNGEFQGATSTTRAGDTWQQRASVFTAAGRTLVTLSGWKTSMATANTWEPWGPRRFRFDALLYRFMDALEFQGECS